MFTEEVRSLQKFLLLHPCEPDSWIQLAHCYITLLVQATSLNNSTQTNNSHQAVSCIESEHISCHGARDDANCKSEVCQKSMKGDHLPSAPTLYQTEVAVSAPSGSSVGEDMVKRLENLKLSEQDGASLVSTQMPDKLVIATCLSRAWYEISYSHSDNN